MPEIPAFRIEVKGQSGRRRYPKTDSQRSRVYRAESSVLWSEKASAQLTEAETRDWVKRAVKYARTMGFSISRDVEVEFQNRRSGRAHAIRGGLTSYLYFSTPARKPWVVMHEVAHLVLPRRHPDFDGDDRSHGWVWADIYLRLVGKLLSAADRDALKASFRTHDVRFRPKRQRVLTPEQKAAAADRLAKARASRPVRPKYAYRIGWTPDGQPIYLASSERRDSAVQSTPGHRNHWGDEERRCDGATTDLSRAITRTDETKLREWAVRYRWWLLKDEFNDEAVVDVRPLLEEEAA